MFDLRRLRTAARGAAALAFLTAAPVVAQEMDGKAATPPADPADVATAEAVVAAAYDAISGGIGVERDWDRFRSLFVPGARLMPVAPARDGAPARLYMVSVEEYIDRVDEPFLRDGFFEREVARRVEHYGHMTHVFSTYEGRRTPEDPEPFLRGINSFQLFHDGERWWIVSIMWDAERPGQPLPERYLPSS